MVPPDIFLGIDFGTSNSSIAYVINDPVEQGKQVRVKTVQIENDESSGGVSVRMPTLLFIDPTSGGKSEVLLGWEVLRKFAEDRESFFLRHGEDFFRSIKSDIGSSRIYPHASSPELNTPEKVMAAVIRFLLREAERELGEGCLDRARVVVTVPASLSAHARAATKEAVIMAGVAADRLELIDEPIAALIDFLHAPKSSLFLTPDT